MESDEVRLISLIHRAHLEFLAIADPFACLTPVEIRITGLYAPEAPYSI